MQSARLLWCALPIINLGSLLVLSCATAMKLAGGCTNVPTVEECNIAALRITDSCLRACVAAQCSGITVRCGDPITLNGCSKPRSGGRVGGFVQDGGTCKVPSDEVHWCDLSVPASCRPLMMVHELAHACGWGHGDGMGVPGNGGRAAWRYECE